MNDEPTAKSPTGEQITEHMPLVHRIVAHFVRRLPRSVQREDLVAAGTLGLFHALRSSAHTCPEMFAAYARIRIRGAIVDELRRHDWSPRRRRQPEVEMAEATDEVGATKPTLVSTTNTKPASTLPAPASLAERSERTRSTRSICVVGFDDLPARGNAAPSFADDCASPLDDVLERRAHAALHEAVNKLPSRERVIVGMRYFQGMPSKAIAQALGLSEARVSQLHARATSRLRDLLADSTEEVKLAA